MAAAATRARGYLAKPGLSASARMDYHSPAPAFDLNRRRRSFSRQRRRKDFEEMTWLAPRGPIDLRRAAHTVSV
jgi:hypothetical protein